jgi:hypothetical protein
VYQCVVVGGVVVVQNLMLLCVFYRELVTRSRHAMVLHRHVPTIRFYHRQPCAVRPPAFVIEMKHVLAGKQI